MSASNYRSPRHLARILAIQQIYAKIAYEEAVRIANQRAQEEEVEEVVQQRAFYRTEPDYIPRQDLQQVLSEEADAAVYEKADRALLEKLVKGVVDHADTLREQFAGLIDRDVNRLSFVEHAILLLGTYELMYSIDTPYRVIINEEIELAKSFGGTDGFKFINGVLDKLAVQLRPDEVQ